MQISGKGPPAQPPQGVTAARAAQKSVTRDEDSPVKGERIDLSDRAREFFEARLKVKQMPDVDEDKVARIKAQLKAGTYRIDSRLTAVKMLEEALLGSRD